MSSPPAYLSLSIAEVDRVIEMAWEDRTPFEAIEQQFGLTESDVIMMMRSELKLTSFKRWRRRVHGRHTKHKQLNDIQDFRFKSSRQRQITLNKITKKR